LHFKFEKHIIHGFRWNAIAAKKILILHGFESSVVNFERYVKPLILKGYCVLAFDAPAHGLSSGSRINALIYKKFINQINVLYGTVTNFISHSLGGLALSLSLEERPHDKSFKVVFIAPATETTTAVESFFKFLKLDEGIRKSFNRHIEKIASRPPEWYSVSRAAKNIKASVLWLQDKDDVMTPLSDVVPIMEKNYPNFEFVITEGLGHRRIYRDNKVKKRIIDFFE
jgi:pimeloyl-ACP methyl ester carboxylesterase